MVFNSNVLIVSSVIIDRSENGHLKAYQKKPQKVQVLQLVLVQSPYWLCMDQKQNTASAYMTSQSGEEVLLT